MQTFYASLSYLFKIIWAIAFLLGFSATFSNLIPSCSSYCVTYSAFFLGVSQSLNQPALSCFNLSHVFTYSAKRPVRWFSGVKWKTSWILISSCFFSTAFWISRVCQVPLSILSSLEWPHVLDCSSSGFFISSRTQDLQRGKVSLPPTLMGRTGWNRRSGARISTCAIPK